MRLPKRLLALLPLVSLVLPTASLAATPQQIFSKSVDQTFKKGTPLRFDAKLNVKSDKTSEGKSEQVEADLQLMLRFRQDRKGVQDQEGRLVLKKFKTSGGSSGLPNLEQPLALEWKSINKTFFLRVKIDQLPEDVRQQLGPDVVKIIGQWMMLESTEAKQATQQLGTQAAASLPVKVGSLDAASGFTAELKKLQVVKIEKIERRKNGDLVYRLRLRMDPAEIDKAEKLKRAEIAKLKDAAAKKTASEAAKKDFAKQREDAKSFWFAATVNSTSDTLERLEIAGWDNETTAATKYTAASKRRTDVKLGVDFRRNGDWEVEKPKNFLDLKEVIAGLMAESLKKSAAAAQAMQVEKPDAAQSVSPAVGLTDVYLDSATGFKVSYPHGWASQSGQGSITLTGDFKEDGISPEIAVWSFDPISGLDEDAMIQSIIGQVRDNLLLTAVEKDGWTYTLTAPEAVMAKNTMDGYVIGKSFLMTRNTDLGVIVTRIAIYPNVAGDKYLAIMFHEPLVPSASLEQTRDAILDSFTILNQIP